jgi:hypothetical protein
MGILKRLNRLRDNVSEKVYVSRRRAQERRRDAVDEYFSSFEHPYETSNDLLKKSAEELSSIDFYFKLMSARVLTPKSFDELNGLFKSVFGFNGAGSKPLVLFSYTPNIKWLRGGKEVELKAVEEYPDAIGLDFKGIFSSKIHDYAQALYPMHSQPGVFATLAGHSEEKPAGIFLGRGSSQEGQHEKYYMMYKLNYFRQHFPATHKIIVEGSHADFVSVKSLLSAVDSISEAIQSLEGRLSSPKMHPTLNDLTIELQDTLRAAFYKCDLYDESASGWFERAAHKTSLPERQKYISWASYPISLFSDRLSLIKETQEALGKTGMRQGIQDAYVQLEERLNELKTLHKEGVTHPETFDLRLH